MWNLSDCPILHQASEIRPTKAAESVEDSTAVDMQGKASKYLLDVIKMEFPMHIHCFCSSAGYGSFNLNLAQSPSFSQ
jgi:hypothetical protein